MMDENEARKRGLGVPRGAIIGLPAAAMFWFIVIGLIVENWL